MYVIFLLKQTRLKYSYICFLLFERYKNNIKRYNLYQEVYFCDVFFILINLVFINFM